MNELKSIGYTFLAGFLMEIYPLIKEVSLENFTKAFVVAVLFAGIRSGIKALIEAFLKNTAANPQ